MNDDHHSLRHHVALLKVIADETRLRILGLLSERDHTGKELADVLGLTPPTVSHHMRKLSEAGIVTASPDAQRIHYALNSQLLRDIRKESSPTGSGDRDVDEREKTLNNFFEGDRLKSIPAKRKQRVIVLQKLMERFEPGRHYPEAEVNELLGQAHEDYATLRRELVDYGFMVRDKGIYEVAVALPTRSRQVAQEITGDEQAWLSSLISATLRDVR